MSGFGLRIKVRYSEDPQIFRWVIGLVVLDFNPPPQPLVIDYDADFQKGLYQHSKSKMQYLVLSVVRDVATNESFIWYQAMYDHPELGDKQHWVRPINNFMEKVRLDSGELVPRFQFISEPILN